MSLPCLSHALAAVALLSLLAVEPPEARAEGDATACTALNDATARLACYDRLHGRAGATPPVLPVATDPPTAPAAPVAAAAEPTLLSRRWDLDGQQGLLFTPRAYQPVYILPASWTDAVNREPSSPAPDHSVTEPLTLKSAEVKYQISLKTKFAHRFFGTPASLWGGYTQSSRWQVYNGATSRPFRETNYEPELMMVLPLKLLLAGWDVQMATLALNHQSNGRSLPLSRSWNRVVVGAAAERGDWVAELRAWQRIREKPGADDNPDIEDHIGRAELRVGRFWGEQTLALQLRHTLRGGARSRGSAQFDYVFPISGALHGHVQLFEGYGESLIDYNRRQTRLGVGVTIAGWR